MDTPFAAKRTIIATSLSLILATPFAHAADDSTTTELSKVEVTAKKEQKVTAKTIANKQANTLQDVLKDQADVSVGGGGIGSAQKVYVRNLEDTLMNVSIDGAQQTGYLFHHQGRVSVEPEIIKSVEAEAGTGAATAGPGALAGSVNFETKDATDMLREGEQAGGIVKSTYYSNGSGLKRTATVFGRTGDDSGILVSGSRFGNNNYTNGNGDTVANSATRQDDLFAKYSGYLNEHHYISLSQENKTEEGVRALRQNIVTASWNTPNDASTYRTTTTFNHKYTSDNPMVNTKETIYHTNSSMEINRNSVLRSAGVETWGSDFRNTSKFKNLDLTYGTDYRHDVAYTNGANAVNDEDLTVAGLYTQGDYRFAPDWLLSTGARLDSYDYNDNIGQNFSSHGISPNIGLTYWLTDDLDVFVKHARALRGVGLKEVYTMAGTTNSAHIDPEKAHTTEFGTEYENGNLRAKAEGFTQRIENYYNASGTRANQGTVELWGYSGDVSYSFGNFETRIGMNYSRPSLDGEPLSGSDFTIGMPTGRTWTTGIDYHMPAQRVDLGWTGRAVERLTYAADGERSGYMVHDVYVAWKPMANKDLDLRFTIANLFNKYYWDQTTISTTNGIAEPGRDYRLTASYRF